MYSTFEHTDLIFLIGWAMCKLREALLKMWHQHGINIAQGALPSMTTTNHNGTAMQYVHIALPRPGPGLNKNKKHSDNLSKKGNNLDYLRASSYVLLMKSMKGLMTHQNRYILNCIRPLNNSYMKLLKIIEPLLPVSPLFPGSSEE
jgi:hypothetical protein